MIENTSTYLGYTEEDYAYMEARKKDPSLPEVLIKNVDGANRYIHYGNTDWWDVMFKDNQFSMDHNLSLSGGNDVVKYYTSARFYTREGIYNQNTDVVQSVTLRNKVDFKLHDKVKLTNTTNFYFSNYNYPATNNREVGGSDNHEDWSKYIYQASPLYLPYNPDGSIMIYSPYAPTRNITGGSYADLLYGKSNGKDREQDVSNTISLEYKPIEGLTLNADYTFRLGTPTSELLLLSTPHTNQPNGEGVEQFQPSKELYKEMHVKTNYQAFNAFATYSKTFDTDHNFKALLGYNQEWRTWERTVARRDSPVSEELGSFNLATGENVQIQGNASQWAIMGTFFRLNYDYAGRYLLEVNGRFDWSSKFPKNNRLGFFPSASFAWRVSEESFFEGAKEFMSNLKLRASYGELGNQNVGAYDYIAKMKATQGSYIVDGVLNTYLTTPEAISSNFTWERSATLNTGLDFSLFGGRLNTTFDWFQRDTKDMLTEGKELPSVFGTDEPMENAADLRTYGYELSVQWRDKVRVGNHELGYHVGAVLGDSRTFITKFDNPTGDITQYYVGQELGEIWGYSVEGFFQSDDEYLSHADQALVNRRIETKYLINHPIAGDIKFKDIDGDMSINPGKKTLNDHGDLRMIGNSSARYNLGVNLGLNYAGFEISAFFQGVLKQDWWPGKDNTYFWGPFVRQYCNFYPQSIESNSWTPENPDAYFPRLAPYATLNGKYEGSQLGVYSDKYLQNAAYVRLKDLTVGYTIPNELTRKIMLQKVRFYVSGQNLFTFSSLYKNNPDRTIDPEQLGDGNAYPFSKTVLFGLDITF